MKYFGPVGQRLAAYGAAAFILWKAGLDTGSILPALLIVIVFLLEYISHSRGMMEGIRFYRSCPPDQKKVLDEVFDALDQAEKDANGN